MTDIAQSIDLDLTSKLKDREYRRDFFWAQASAEIAGQLVKLRKRRELNQKQVADMIGTKQPAISRAEQADYQNWNLNTLRMIGDALDARVRVVIEPSEDILAEYDDDAKYDSSVANNAENSDHMLSRDLLSSGNSFVQIIGNINCSAQNVIDIWGLTPTVAAPVMVQNAEPVNEQIKRLQNLLDIERRDKALVVAENEQLRRTIGLRVEDIQNQSSLQRGHFQRQTQSAGRSLVWAGQP